MCKKQIIKLHTYEYNLFIGKPSRGGFLMNSRFQYSSKEKFGRLGFRLCKKEP